MKYTIEGFSQEYAMTLKKMVERTDRRSKTTKLVEIKIDCTDLVILRWFVDFYPKMKKVIVNGKEYAWLTHKKLVEDLPLIDISKEAFNERMKKLVEFNILEYQFIKEGGSFSLYSFGENYENLVSKQGGICSNTYGVYVQQPTGVYVQTPTKDNTIIDNTINNIYIMVLDYLNDKAGTHFKPVDCHIKLIKARLKSYSLEQVKGVIDMKVKEWKGTSMQQYLRPKTLFCETNFENYVNCLPAHISTARITEKSYSKEELNSLFSNLEDIEI